MIVSNNKTIINNIRTLITRQTFHRFLYNERVQQTRRVKEINNVCVGSWRLLR